MLYLSSYTHKLYVMTEYSEIIFWFFDFLTSITRPPSPTKRYRNKQPPDYSILCAVRRLLLLSFKFYHQMYAVLETIDKSFSFVGAA